MRFIIKSRAGVIWDAQKKYRFLHEGDGMCACGKPGYFNHLMNSCMQQGTKMTKRHDAIVTIVTQAAQLHRIREDEEDEIDAEKYVLGQNTQIQLPNNINKSHTWKDEEGELVEEVS
jgi:hypothetical protein